MFVYFQKNAVFCALFENRIENRLSKVKSL
jgi:hypothetical protein